MEHFEWVLGAVEGEQHTEPLIQLMREEQVCMEEATVTLEAEIFELLWFEGWPSVVEQEQDAEEGD